MAGSCCPSATATEARRCPTTRARPFRGRMDDCSYSLSRMRRSGTARCPRPLPGPRTCYRTRRAQKTRRVLVRGSGSTTNRHTHTARARNEGRGRRTHTTNTLRARRDGRHERSIRHTHPIQKCDRVPSEYAEPGLRRGRWHNLQIDGTARPSYGGRWLLRRAFSRSTRWLMWSWTTGSITGDHERATGFHGVISINFGFWAELALYRRDAATRSDSALICGCF